MNRLKELRKSKRMTVRELSDLSGIVFSTISALENGKRRMNAHHAKVLAPILGVTESFIIGDDNFSIEPDIQSFFGNVWTDMFDEVVSGAMDGTLDEKSKQTYVLIDRLIHCNLSSVELKAIIAMVDALIQKHEEDC